MKLFLSFVVLMFVTVGQCEAAQHRFEEFPATSGYLGKFAAPQFDGRDEAFKEYRTRIINGLKQGPNFAGEFSIVEFGCGTACVQALVTSSKTGRVTPFQLTNKEVEYFELKYDLGSRLILAEYSDPESHCRMLEQLVWNEDDAQSLGVANVDGNPTCATNFEKGRSVSSSKDPDKVATAQVEASDQANTLDPGLSNENKKYPPQPSFPCSDVSDSPDMRAICQDEKLSKLDQLTNRGYMLLRAKIGKKKANQLTSPFLKARQQCGSDHQCIAGTQMAAIEAFKSQGVNVEPLPYNSSESSADSQMNHADPKFSDYPAKTKVRSGELAPAKLSSKDSHMEVGPTTLGEIMRSCEKNPINFAGIYTACATNGGTGRQNNYMINRLTGEVIDMPPSTQGFTVRAKSNLLASDPGVSKEDGDWELYSRFYVWNGRSFSLVGENEQGSSLSSNSPFAQ